MDTQFNVREVEEFQTAAALSADPFLFPFQQGGVIGNEANVRCTEGIMFVFGTQMCPILLTSQTYYHMKYHEDGYSATDAMQEICEGPLDWSVSSILYDSNKAKLLYAELMRHKHRINTLFNMRAPYKVIRVVHVVGVTIEHLKRDSEWRKEGEALYNEHILKVLELRRLAEEATATSNQYLEQLYDDLLFQFDEDILTDE